MTTVEDVTKELKPTRICISSAPVARNLPSGLKYTARMKRSPSSLALPCGKTLYDDQGQFNQRMRASEWIHSRAGAKTDPHAGKASTDDEVRSKETRGRANQKTHQHLSPSHHGEITHYIFAPVFTSKICAVRLQPVARKRPSAEKRTQQTTLEERVSVRLWLRRKTGWGTKREGE